METHRWRYQPFVEGVYALDGEHFRHFAIFMLIFIPEASSFVMITDARCELHTHSRNYNPAKLQVSLPESSRLSPESRKLSLISQKLAHSPQSLCVVRLRRHHCRPPPATSQLTVSKTSKQTLRADASCTVRISTSQMLVLARINKYSRRYSSGRGFRGARSSTMYVDQQRTLNLLSVCRAETEM